MGLRFKKLETNGVKMTQTKVVEMSFIAADAITLNGFNSVEELYNLLKLNCMKSPVIIDQTIKELAIRYNERAAAESEKIYSDPMIKANPAIKEAHIANAILMNNKLKLIADVRSFMVTQCSDDLESLPIFDSTTEYVGNKPTKLLAAEPLTDLANDENLVQYKASIF